MKSNYPHGWSGGVTIRGIPQTQAHPGNVYWVNNSTVLAEGAIAGSNGNPGTYTKPFSTVDYAVGRCLAGRGDVIMIMPGHAENVTAAAGIAFDVAGITVMGLGKGNQRPVFTWSGTDSAATVTVSAANITLDNMVFECNDAGDDVVAMLVVSGDDAELSKLEFRQNDDAALIYVQIADATDRCYIHDCRMFAAAAGGNNAITFTGVTTAANGLRIVNNHIYGHYATGAILCADATQILSDVLIKDNVIVNLSSGDYAIDCTSGTNMVGVITGNRVDTSAEATSIRSGGCTLIDNRWGLDQKESVAPGTTTGAAVVSVAPQMNITSTTADEIAVVTSGGPILVTSIVGFCNTLHEAEAAAVFDNIVTGASGNLYAADQETALQDSSFEVGDYVVFAQDAPVVVEQATSQTEDSRGLNWLIAASDTIDIEGGSAEAEGKATLIISYVSLGGELEVEAV